ncbi:MAG: oxygenase MpaB family protein [Cellulomonas sp.]
MSLLAQPRAALAHALLSRVAGPDADAARDAIHRTPGPRWFDPESPIGRVHGDASMFVGGVRALLLQSLHPQVMQAVADHSGYRSNPWGRLQNTATFIAATTFGTVEASERAVRIVRAVHKRVVGATPSGVGYAASDAHLLTWVHVVEAESFLLAHQIFGRSPLDRAGCDEYVAQSAVVARALGAEDVPTTLAELRASLAGFRPELASTEPARDVARFLLLSPPLPWPARPGYGLIAGAGVGLLPVWARRELALPTVAALDPVLRAGGRAVTSTIRWALDPVDPVRTALRAA